MTDTELMGGNHPAKLARLSCGDDDCDDECGICEDYVDYLGRQGDAWSQSPPPAPPGFELIECTATPRHWPLYTVVDDDFYAGPDCLYCTASAYSDRISRLEHDAHRAWQRWRITGKLGGWLYTTGITSTGASWRMGGHCPGCYTLPKFNRNRRPYILGVSRETWHCLLRRHHRPSVDRPFGLCTKCFPCAECGSTATGHHCEAAG